MGDDDDGLVVVIDDGSEGGQDLGGRVGVEVAGGFVAEDDVGPADECAGAGDALLMAPGEFGGPVIQAFREAE